MVAWRRPFDPGADAGRGRLSARSILTGTPRIAVIGAGPAGLAAAVRGIDAGATVEVFEASPAVGGLAKSVDLFGHTIDLGSHILSGGPAEGVELWERFLGDDPHPVPLRRGILRQGTIVCHPPQPLDLLGKLPLGTSLQCAVGAARARLSATISEPSNANAEDWVVSRFGRPVYDVLLRDYVEKLWGAPGTDIDPGFAAGLLAEKSRLDRTPGGAKAGEFLFPRGGTGAVWKRMRELVEHGGRLFLQMPIEKLLVANGRVTGVRVAGVDRPADFVISSMAIPRLLSAAGMPSSGTPRVQTRHAMLVHLHVSGGAALPYTWIYVYDREFAVGRIVDSRFWQGTRNDTGIVTMEYWCGGDDSAWTLPDAQVVELARRELESSGVLPDVRVLDGSVTRLPNALPVPALESRAWVRRAEEQISTIGGLASIGRHGEFAFNSMAESMASGIHAADIALIA